MAKVISLPEIRKRLSAFVADWKDAEGYERGEAPQFVRDLLQCFGLTKKTAALYEKRAKRMSTDSRGFIDALVPGLALIEMKSAGKDLREAELQALDYIGSLTESERPQWVITSDFFNFRVLDLFAPEGADTVTFTLDELPENAEHLAFFAGHQTRSFGNAEQEEASVKAARLMGSLYEEVAKAGLDDHEASVFLVRTLFALYADDSGLWRRDLFYEFLEEHTHEDGSDLGAQLSSLYQLLNQPLERRPENLGELLSQFPYVNGGVFGAPISIPIFGSAMSDKLLEACAFNWSAISPAVFGSLFQSVKDAKARRELGEHYTTETNILKLIGPLFMDELKQQFAESLHNVKALRKLHEQLGEIRIMDPACGCGNFLVVAMREMRSLELDILERIRELEGDAQLGFFADDLIKVRMDNFRGIEIEEWPAQIATTALYLVQHQANQRMAKTLGLAPDPLPLIDNHCITIGNALRTNWEDILSTQESGALIYVIGNPPFVGHQTKTRKQSDDLVAVWGKEGRDLDYVTAWYKRAAEYLGDVPGARFAFVSTNSITQGKQVSLLFPPIMSAGWRIRFAHQSFSWSSEAPGAAQVHCVIIGFDKEPEKSAQIFIYETGKSDPKISPVTRINGYLMEGPDIYVTQRSNAAGPLAKDLSIVSFGTMPVDGGNLIVEVDEYAEVAADPIAAKYLHPFRMGKEMINGLDRWCLWMEDLDPADVGKSAVLKSRINACREYREAAPKGGDAYKLRDTPHLFRPNSNRPLSHYLAIPAVFSENRKWATCDWLPPEVIAGNKLYTCIDPDGFAFAIISSSMFITWQDTIGGRLEMRRNFSNTVVWNNLPLPPVSDDLRQKIIEAGQGVLAARALHPERSLADHYNPLAMDPELLRAHCVLDKVVDQAFGCTVKNPTEADRQQTLFARYQELTQN